MRLSARCPYDQHGFPVAANLTGVRRGSGARWASVVMPCCQRPAIVMLDFLSWVELSAAWRRHVDVEVARFAAELTRVDALAGLAQEGR